MSNTQSLQPEIIPLDSNLIHLANYNSFNGNRGNLSNESYQAYGKEILEWPIADGKKRKLLDELYKRYSKILKYESLLFKICPPSKAPNARCIKKPGLVVE